jgi:hypothetical protein
VLRRLLMRGTSECRSHLRSCLYRIFLELARLLDADSDVEIGKVTPDSVTSLIGLHFHHSFLHYTLFKA